MNGNASGGWLDEVETRTKVVTSVELGSDAGDQRTSGLGASKNGLAVKLVDALLRQAVCVVPRTCTLRRRAPRCSCVFASTERCTKRWKSQTPNQSLAQERRSPRRYVDTGAATPVTRGNAEASDLGHESESDVAHALVEAAHEGRNGSR
jgi:hypothetical protein